MAKIMLLCNGSMKKTPAEAYAEVLPAVEPAA